MRRTDERGTNAPAGGAVEPGLTPTQIYYRKNRVSILAWMAEKYRTDPEYRRRTRERAFRIYHENPSHARATLGTAANDAPPSPRPRGRPLGSTVFPVRDAAIVKLRLGSGPLIETEREWVRPGRRGDAAVVRPRTLEEVADLFGLTHERVRQILAREGLTGRAPRGAGGAGLEQARPHPAKTSESVRQMPAKSLDAVGARDQLAQWFRSSGYVRRQNRRRLAEDGYAGYKKGDEVRLVANSLPELQVIRRLLRQAGFKPGRPFAHANQWRQPLYGRDNVARFLALVYNLPPR